jgi:hypothetical protein
MISFKKTGIHFLEDLRPTPKSLRNWWGVMIAFPFASYSPSGVCVGKEFLP